MSDTPETDALIARLLQESDTEVADMTEVDRTVVEFLKQKERELAALKQRCAELEHALRTAVSYAKAGRIDWTAKMQAVLDAPGRKK